MSKAKDYPKTPECERLKDVAPVSQKIGEFVDWLQTEKKFIICEEYEDGGITTNESAYLNMEKLLAEFFEINMDKVEKERRALLAWVQKQNG